MTYRFITNEDELYHFGVKGMKWGRRRFQNSDGSLTAAGQKRYGSQEVRDTKQAYKTAKKEYNQSFNKAYNKAYTAYSPIKKHRENNDARWEDAAKKAENLNKAKADYKQAKKAYNESEEGQAAKAARRKKALKVGAAVTGTALAAYGAYKASELIKNKAAKKSYESGKKYAQEHFFSKMDNSFTGKQSANEYQHLMSAGRKTLANTDKRTKKVSKSTIESIKYLKDPNSMMVDGELLDWF